GIQSTQRVEVMNRLIKEGVKITSSLYELHQHIQILLDNEAKGFARTKHYDFNNIQQQATNIIIPDFYIIEQIHGTNICSATNQQVANKKVKYAKGFGKMKRLLLNLALDFEFNEVLINIITLFTNQKMSARNIDDESSLDQLESIIINDPLVTKHREWPPTKVPLSNIDSNNSYASGENKRKYVYNICGGSEHNARICKQINDSEE
ncbi:26274_t:CDS:2, partial [Gigaspora rosea]